MKLKPWPCRALAPQGIWVVAALWLGLMAAPSRADDSLPPAGPYFAPGEELKFSIDYGVINAGEATLEVKSNMDYEGHEVIHVRSRARSNRFFSALFRVRDQADSFIDADSLCSRYFAKHLREGDFRREVEIHFDQEANIAYFPDGRQSDVPPGVQEVLSAFFRVRAMDLAPGQEFDIPTHGDKKLYPLRVRVHRRETIHSVLGEQSCLVIQPFLEDDGLFKHEGDLLIWITDDRRHIPLKVKANIPVGSVTAKLKHYRPPSSR